MLNNITVKFRSYVDSKLIEDDLDEINYMLFKEDADAENLEQLDFEDKKSFFWKHTGKRVLRGVRNGFLFSLDSAKSLQQFGGYFLVSIGSELLIILFTVAGVVVKRILNVEKVPGTFSTPAEVSV